MKKRKQIVDRIMLLAVFLSGISSMVCALISNTPHTKTREAAVVLFYIQAGIAIAMPIWNSVLLRIEDK